MGQQQSVYWQRFRTFFATTTRLEIAGTALRVSAVVGTVLNVINQFDALRGRAPLSTAHLFLNYLIPYCVATYGAARYAVRTEAGDAERGLLQPSTSLAERRG